MRLVRLLVPRDDVEALVGVLDDEEIDHVVTEEESRNDAVLVEFPLPVQAIDAVLGTVEDAGVDLDTYTVVASAETARTEGFDALEQRFVEGTEESDSVGHEEVRTKARSLLPDARTYYAMTVLSALVATAGLLLDSPAVVIATTGRARRRAAAPLRSRSSVPTR